jgi:hypothetical protein
VEKRCQLLTTILTLDFLNKKDFLVQRILPIINAVIYKKDHFNLNKKILIDIIEEHL